MKDVGDLVGASAILCVAIRSLIDLQERLDVDATTLRLTREWETAARETHDNIDDRFHDLASTGPLERPFPEVPNTANWINSWHLGAGSFGSASLYIQFSDSGNITNRVVVKDCDYNQSQKKRDMYKEDNSLWTEDRNGAKIPMEVATVFDLREKPGSEYIVKILNWRMGPQGRHLFRLYLEVSCFNR
jgi:hypothetical protein